MSRILVTGASGFLGRHVVSALIGRGHEVHALSRNPDPEIAPRAQWHRGDLLDRGGVPSILESASAEGLVHLAWVTEQPQYWTSDANLDWVASSLRLFRDFHDMGGKRLVAAGTSAEYEWRGDAPLDEETTPLRPASLYGICRNSLREILQSWAPAAGISWAWGRLFNIFGPHEQPGKLVPRVVTALLAGRDVPFDDGTLVRDFLHVSDAADAFATLYDSGYQGAVNIASGASVPVKALLGEIARTVEGPSKVRFGALPLPSDAPPRIVAATARLRGELGWSPALGLQEAVADTCRWWIDTRAR